MPKLKLYRSELVLKHQFTISRRSFDRLENLVVALEDADGLVGYGEATHNPYYPNTAISYQIQRLEALRPLIEAHPLDHPIDLWESLASHLSDCPFALCAIDVAAHDLCARRANLPLYAYWAWEKRDWPVSSYTLSINPLEVMIQQMQEMAWSSYKIKLGRANDLEIIRGLRAHTSVPFRVDINGAWSVEQCLEYAPQLAELGVEFIEQPLAADNWAGMKKLYAASPLPLFADESCCSEEDVERCRGHFHGVNIKLMKCGGLTPALRMIERARELELQVMVGCMTESTVGISAIAQLLPQIDFVDMDGPLFLAKDIAKGVQLTSNGVIFAEKPGTGVELLIEHL